jgi:hypothetical protein
MTRPLDKYVKLFLKHPVYATSCKYCQISPQHMVSFALAATFTLIVHGNDTLFRQSTLEGSPVEYPAHFIFHAQHMQPESACFR